MDKELVKPVGVLKNNDNLFQATVWAPKAEQVDLIVEGQDKPFGMQSNDFGYWSVESDFLKVGSKYKFLLDQELERPDPASLSQPEGVHGWSEVVDQEEYVWQDTDWQPPSMADWIIYELHVGTFTPEGTFEAVIGKLDHLLELGVNVIELMPIAQFPGKRNWGYDGVYPFAVQQSYGGVAKLKQLIDSCHQKGIAVILDVVYNHMGPEGNYLNDFGPYFTDRYNTPWGSALNFDDSYSDHVRNFFLQNALMWLRDFHFDGLRLDAVHAIMDIGPRHFLKELRMQVDELEKQTRRSYCLIAESDLNDVKLISPYQNGGYGLQGQWTDDFHHAVHTMLTGEKEGYYADFGEPHHLEKAYKQGMVYDGTYSPFRKKLVGTDPSNNAKHQFVVCIQNHDQVGNRMMGDRLTKTLDLEQLKLAASLMLTAPYLPMLFMGEEYGEDRPFQYFVHHGDADLVKAVQEGRAREFEDFQWKGEVPDPQSEKTFQNSKLDWDFGSDKGKRLLFQFYRHLISLRKDGAFLPFREKAVSSESMANGKVLHFMAGTNKCELLAVVNIGSSVQRVELPQHCQSLKKVISSSDQEWGGSGEIMATAQGGEVLEIPSHSLTIFTEN